MPSKTKLCLLAVTLTAVMFAASQSPIAEAIPPFVVDLGDLLDAQQVTLDDHEVRITINDAKPTILIKTLIDTNNPTCEASSPGFPSQGWCPNVFHQTYVISDVDVEETSFIIVAMNDDSGSNSNCVVTDIDEDSFEVVCQPTPIDGAELYYMIVE